MLLTSFSSGPAFLVGTHLPAGHPVVCGTDVQYAAVMSAKQQIVQAMESLPDSLTLEEIVERLYRAFKLKQAQNESPAELEPLPVLEGRIPEGWKDAIYE